MPDCPNIVSCCDDPLFQVTNPTPPPPTIPLPPPPTQPTVFHNTAQTAISNCPAGTIGAPSSVTIPANTSAYDSMVDQAAADNAAYAAALAQAQAALSCVPSGGLAAQLSGLVWSMPGYQDGPHIDPSACVDPPDQSAVAVGSTGHIYTARLRVRGVVEFLDYAGGGIGGALAPSPGTTTTAARTIPAFNGSIVVPVVSVTGFSLDNAVVTLAGYDQLLTAIDTVAKTLTLKNAFNLGTGIPVFPSQPVYAWGHLFTCSNHTQAIPALPGDTHNEYALIVSDPAETYLLNGQSSTPINVHPVDYRMTIQVKTGATVTLKARSIDGHEYPNNALQLIIPDDDPSHPIMFAQTPFFDGQALQMDCVLLF